MVADESDCRRKEPSRRDARLPSGKAPPSPPESQQTWVTVPPDMRPMLGWGACLFPRDAAQTEEEQEEEEEEEEEEACCSCCCCCCGEA